MILMHATNAGFQSTLPRGSDRLAVGREIRLLLISIHAPSRERPGELIGYRLPDEFQSTLPRGSDPETGRRQEGV